MELQRDFYVGVVEDNKDPNRKGRIKVRVQTLYHSIDVADIPYAYPFAGLAGKEFQVPAIGKLVNILFLSDDLYSPYYIYSENYNVNLQNKLKTLNDEDYVDFIALLFDETTQIFVKHKELTIDLLLNKITIDDNTSTINLELKDNTQILNLGSRQADQQAVLGTRYFKWMDKFIQELMKPTSLIGNQGKAVLKPKLDILCQEYMKLRPDFVSNNVFIVDNGKVIKLKRYPDTDARKNDIDLILPPELKPDKLLQAAIQAANTKACQTLANAAPTSKINIPIPSSSLNVATSTVPGIPSSAVIPQQDPNLAAAGLSPVWDSASQQKITELHPIFRDYVTKFINKAQAQGIKLKIQSGYRSAAYTFQLQAQWDSGNHTGLKVRPVYPSMHNFGLAIDVSQTNGTPNWGQIGQIGKSVGLAWGGDFGDEVHFDARTIDGGLLGPALLAKVNKGDVINGFVNLGQDPSQPEKITSQQLASTSTGQYNGQNYATSSTNTPCDTSAFNAGAQTNSTPDDSTSSQSTSTSSSTSGNVVVGSQPIYTGDLLFSNLVTSNKQEFLDKVKVVASNLGIDPNDLMTAMFLESTLNPQAKSKTSSATGLLQWLEGTANRMGTTTAKIYNMTNVQQLDYVYKYLSFPEYKGKLTDFTSIYSLIFYPAIILDGGGHLNDNSWVLGSQSGPLAVASKANANSGLDLNKDNQITIGEFKRNIYSRIPNAEKQILAQNNPQILNPPLA